MSGFAAFGSYIAGDSPVHTMNAQVKIVLACVFSISVLLVNTWWALGVCWLVAAALFVWARIPVSRAWGGMKVIGFVALMTVLFHAFAWDVNAGVSLQHGQAGSVGLTQTFALWGSWGVVADGVVTGLFFALRILLAVVICSLLTFTTSTSEVTEGLRCIVSPLAHVHVPVEDLSMVVSIALRFIPTTVSTAQDICKSALMRGAEFDGTIVARLKAWSIVMIPLFVRLFKKADDLATALNARCYYNQARTHLHAVRPQIGEVVIGVLGCVACVALGYVG